MSQTTIFYNNIEIKDVLTDGEFSIAPELDVTGVDQVGITVTASWTGIIHASPAAKQHGLKVGDLGADFSGILSALNTKGRRFKLMIGQSVVYDIGAGAVPPGTSRIHKATAFHSMDISHGPHPDCKIIAIISGYSATVRFSIKFTIPSCSKADMGNGLLNLRWWIKENIDCSTWLTQRVYEGVLQVAHKDIDPHLLARQLAIPPLQRGFQRQVVQLNESEDGLHLHFVIQDQETIAAAPWFVGQGKGAIDWSGSFKMSTQYFASATSELTFTLTGPKGTSKSALISLGSKIIEAKTHFAAMAGRARGKKHSAFLEFFGIEESLKDNTVNFNIRILHTGEQQAILALFTLGQDQMVGKPLGDLGVSYDPEVSFHPGPSATVAGRFLTALQTPCNPLAMPQAKEPPPGKYEPKAGQGTKEYTPNDYAPDYAGDKPSPGHLENMYLNSELTSELLFNNGKIALPTGTTFTNGQPTGPTRAIIQLYAPTADRLITMKAARVDAAPEFPRPNVNFKDTAGIEHTQIGEADVTSQAPQLSADNRQLLYKGQIVIRYALSRPPRDSESISVGALPYRTSETSDVSRRIPAELFVRPEKLLT